MRDGEKGMGGGKCVYVGRRVGVYKIYFRGYQRECVGVYGWVAVCVYLNSRE